MINNDGGNPANVPQVICIQELFLEDNIRKNMNRKKNNQKKFVRFSSSNDLAIVPHLTSCDDDGDDGVNLLKQSIWYTAEDYAMMKKSNDMIMHEMSRAPNDTRNSFDNINDIDSSKVDDDARDECNESYSRDNLVPVDVKFSFTTSNYGNYMFQPDHTLGLSTHKELKQRQDRRRRSISTVLEEQEFQLDFELDQRGSGGSSEIDSDIIKDLYIETTQTSKYEALQRAITFSIQLTDSSDDDDAATIASSKLVFDYIMFKNIKKALTGGKEKTTKIDSTEKNKGAITRKIPFHGRTTAQHHRRRDILATKAISKATATLPSGSVVVAKHRKVQNHPRLVVLVQ